MLISAIRRRRRAAASQEPTLESDLRQVLIMAGAMASVGLMLLAGLAALLRGEPAPPTAAPAAQAVDSEATPQLAVARSPRRIRSERAADERRAAREEPRSTSSRPGRSSNETAELVAPQSTVLKDEDLAGLGARAAAPVAPAPEPAAGPTLEEAPFLRGPAEPVAIPPQPASDEASAPAARLSLRQRLDPRALAGRIIPGLRPRAGAPAGEPADTAGTEE